MPLNTYEAVLVILIYILQLFVTWFLLRNCIKSDHEHDHADVKTADLEHK